LREEGYTDDEIGALFFNLYGKKPGSNNSKSSNDNSAQIYNLIGACFLIAGISMLAINTWLSEYAIPLIILGGISLSVKYFKRVKNDKK
jgi:hypothetical protein